MGAAKAGEAGVDEGSPSSNEGLRAIEQAGGGGEGGRELEREGEGYQSIDKGEGRQNEREEKGRNGEGGRERAGWSQTH